jgi:hypothetical protein
MFLLQHYTLYDISRFKLIAQAVSYLGFYEYHRTTGRDEFGEELG